MNIHETLFSACVDLLKWIAECLNTTYVKVNVWIFCIMWPLYTIIITWIALT